MPWNYGTQYVNFVFTQAHCWTLIMTKLYPLHILPPYCFKIHFNIILPHKIHPSSSLSPLGLICQKMYMIVIFNIHSLHWGLYAVLIDIHIPGHVHSHILTCFGLFIEVKYFEAVWNSTAVTWPTFDTRNSTLCRDVTCWMNINILLLLLLLLWHNVADITIKLRTV